MTHLRTFLLIQGLGLTWALLSVSCNRTPLSINHHAILEVEALLAELSQLSGKQTLSGQHNYLGTISESTEAAYELTGAYPAIWGSDFGFSAAGIDDIHFRDTMIQEAIRQHAQGSIITLMWHAVRPIDDEPNGWKESVQNELTPAEWRELLTPGTVLHRRWLAQLDVIAGHLKVLQDHDIPVLWRPYHEMNGGWFWWGKRPGDYQRLWRNMYEYFTHHHELNHLIWVWNANEFRPGEVESYADYFPGLDVVDVLATDVYTENYAIEDYQTLLELAQGKPIAIGECGKLPTPEHLAEQPQWVWFMEWARMLTSKNESEAVRHLYQSARVLHQRPGNP
ncbi:MAG: glycosyl hydrolase [Bacteroidota bacterium]